MNEWIVYLMFGGVSLFMFFLFFYVLRVEKIIENKLARFELSLEELNKEMYLLKKELEKNTSSKEIEEKFERLMDSIVDDVRMIEKKNIAMFEKLKEEITRISHKLKKNNMPEFSNISRHEEEKIINLYKGGYSVEDISRELRIPAGEIELVLKFANIV